MARRTKGPKSRPRPHQKRPAERVSARAAQGREKNIAARDRVPAWLSTTLDAIARQRATGEPLDRVVSAVARSRKLGKSERKRAADAAFAWARGKESAEASVQDALAAYGGIPPSVRDRDCAAVYLCADDTGGADPSDLALPPPLDALIAAAGKGTATAQLPAWLDAALRAHHGERTDALIAALGQRAPVVLTFDPRHVQQADLIAALAAFDVEAAPSPVSPLCVRLSKGLAIDRLPAALRPHVWPMDDGSRAVAAAVDAQPGERVLDLCAGGGGKTRALLQSGATVVAADVNEKRLRGTRKLAGEGARYLVCDGTTAALTAGSFDRVLVDAPCTGTGTLRRAPDLAARLDEGAPAKYAAIQAALLRSATRLVREGGRVVYATCSVLAEENDAVVDEALQNIPGLVEEKRVSLLPSVQGCDGFFYAVLRTGG